MKAEAGFKLMLVTDRYLTGGRPLLELVAQAVAGGVDAVQLREKDLSARPLMELGLKLRPICKQSEAGFIINDRGDLAHVLEADGIHLTSRSYSPEEARKLLGEAGLVGVSTHSLEEANRAERAGADYILFGPVFATASKLSYGPPQGIGALAQVIDGVSLPVYAIGGINGENLDAVLDVGPAGIALISGILSQPDVYKAAARFREKMALLS